MTVIPRRARTAALLLAAVAAGCGSTKDGYSLPVGSDDGGNGTFGGDAGADGTLAALAAHIEENHVAVTIVTVGCSGACADVEAVATGGIRRTRSRGKTGRPIRCATCARSRPWRIASG
jgi:hypothetical protein